MKKIVFACAALVLAATVSAVEKLDPKTCTEAEVRAALAEVLASPKNWEACGRSHNLWVVLAQARFRDVRLEADNALATSGRYAAHFWKYRDSYPKMSTQARAAVGADTAYAKSIAIAERLGCDITATSIFRAGGTIGDLAVYLSEAAACPIKCTDGQLRGIYWKDAMQKAALRAVKKYIRSQGKSFVTKDGVNPCESYITALTTALDAPRFAGLDAWYKSIGLAGIDLSTLPSEAEVAQLKQDVLDGTKDLNGRINTVLYICLGVDGYNAFVKEYNGD